MGGCIPEDAIVAADGEVVGVLCLAEEGTVAVGWEEVEVFIDVVGGGVRNGVAVGWLGSPDLGGNVDEEGGYRGREMV